MGEWEGCGMVSGSGVTGEWEGVMGEWERYVGV